VLARRGASGALQINGDPGGTIYLRDGYLTFAESAAVPDPGSRLVNSRRLGVDQWSRAEQDSRPDGCPGEPLLRRGLADPEEWHALLRTAALDALLALATELAVSPPAGTCFTGHQARCAGSALRIDAGSAWAYARAVTGRLAGQAVLPDARPLLGPSRDQPVFGREASAVLGQINGRATVRELA
jgi:hypothetical protein